MMMCSFHFNPKSNEKRLFTLPFNSSLSFHREQFRVFWIYECPSGMSIPRKKPRAVDILFPGEISINQVFEKLLMQEWEESIREKVKIISIRNVTRGAEVPNKDFDQPVCTSFFVIYDYYYVYKSMSIN